MTVSVCTLAANRNTHLRNVVRGLGRSRRLPDELVVGWMGGPDPGEVLVTSPCPVQVVEVSADGDLPLAAARNAAARAALGDVLVFLDVDCIPGSELVAAYREAVSQRDWLFMGPVRYLPQGVVTADWDEADLIRAGTPHPARPAPARPGLHRTERYELFWSLSFAVRAATYWHRIGGFDESFVGYGGEDTDFAWSARKADVPLAWVAGAHSYHQDHPAHQPPVSHLEAVVHNARRCRAKWDRWPMEGWLRSFETMGLVRWEHDLLEVVRQPTREELEATRTRAFPRQPAASSA